MKHDAKKVPIVRFTEEDRVHARLSEESGLAPFVEHVDFHRGAFDVMPFIGAELEKSTWAFHGALKLRASVERNEHRTFHACVERILLFVGEIRLGVFDELRIGEHRTVELQQLSGAGTREHDVEIEVLLVLIAEDTNRPQLLTFHGRDRSFGEEGFHLVAFFGRGDGVASCFDVIFFRCFLFRFVGRGEGS